MQRKIYSSKSFWKFRKLATAITLNPPKHVDWKDIVRNKIMPCLTNPISGVTGTPEEKKALFEYIKDDDKYSCLLASRMRKTEAFELLYTFKVRTQIIKGKKQICMEVTGGWTETRVPDDYKKDDQLKPFAGQYVTVFHNTCGIGLGKNEYRFREKEIMTKSFKETWDGELTEENVWNAYTKLSTLLHNVTKPNFFCDHVTIGHKGVGTIDNPKSITLCADRPWTCQHKQCIRHTHEGYEQRSLINQ